MNTLVSSVKQARSCRLSKTPYDSEVWFMVVDGKTWSIFKLN